MAKKDTDTKSEEVKDTKVETPETDPVVTEPEKEVAKEVAPPIKETPKVEPEKPETKTEPEEEKSIDPDTFKKEIKDELKTEAVEAEKAEQTRVDTVKAGWTHEAELLAKAGKIPKIEDPNDENDPGVVAKRNLIIKLGVEVRRNQADGNNFVPSLSQIAMLHPEVIEPVAGGDLPISGGSIPTTKTQDFENKEIRGKSMQQIARGE